MIYKSDYISITIEPFSFTNTRLNINSSQFGAQNGIAMPRRNIKKQWKEHGLGYKMIVNLEEKCFQCFFRESDLTICRPMPIAINWSKPTLFWLEIEIIRIKLRRS